MKTYELFNLCLDAVQEISGNYAGRIQEAGGYESSTTDLSVAQNERETAWWNAVRSIMQAHGAVVEQTDERGDTYRLPNGDRISHQDDTLWNGTLADKRKYY